jgi:hypothetical protein
MVTLSLYKGYVIRNILRHAQYDPQYLRSYASEKRIVLSPLKGEAFGEAVLPNTALQSWQAPYDCNH